jgi:hypothetical protein
MNSKDAFHRQVVIGKLRPRFDFDTGVRINIPTPIQSLLASAWDDDFHLRPKASEIRERLVAFEEVVRKRADEENVIVKSVRRLLRTLLRKDSI